MCLKRENDEGMSLSTHFLVIGQTCICWGAQFSLYAQLALCAQFAHLFLLSHCHPQFPHHTNLLYVLLCFKKSLDHSMKPHH
jgi:hypothetical protein